MTSMPGWSSGMILPCEYLRRKILPRLPTNNTTAGVTILVQNLNGRGPAFESRFGPNILIIIFLSSIYALSPFSSWTLAFFFLDCSDYLSLFIQSEPVSHAVLVWPDSRFAHCTMTRHLHSAGHRLSCMEELDYCGMSPWGEDGHCCKL